ncbi:MAG: hypothetical protein DMF06_15085 [Verrucomicrobia bacterium]|nr:MAG: hypothetical protein DMF06_15085 [Verrucomicrobiota bacterium]
MYAFKFELGQIAVIAESGEKGKVVARAEYLECPPSYLMRYQQATGSAVEIWWTEAALRAPEKPSLA